MGAAVDEELCDGGSAPACEEDVLEETEVGSDEPAPLEDLSFTTQAVKDSARATRSKREIIFFIILPPLFKAIIAL